MNCVLNEVYDLSVQSTVFRSENTNWSQGICCCGNNFFVHLFMQVEQGDFGAKQRALPCAFAEKGIIKTRFILKPISCG
jgi:hypothetical protein